MIVPSCGIMLGEGAGVKGSYIFFFSKHALYLYNSGNWAASRLYSRPRKVNNNANQNKNQELDTLHSS